jgi:DNA-binding CsgD family transcriptional regulator
MEAIQYTGVQELTKEERAILDKLSAEYYDKIERQFKNELGLKVHVKLYHKTGDRKKYSIHIKAVAPTKIFNSDKAADWDFARTVHKAFKDLEAQIKHALHTDDQHPKA